jgi:hypothetical protein
MHFIISMSKRAVRRVPSLRRGPVVCDRKGESRHHVMRVLLPD